MQFQELRILSRSIIQELKQSNLPVNPSRENHLESPAKYATMVVQRCQMAINFSRYTFLQFYQIDFKKVFLYREHLLTF